MNWQEYIVKVPGTCGGKPIVKGTRLPVSLLLEFKADGATEDYLLENYPTLYREGLRAAYAYAEAHGMVAYADWGAEDCPYHNPDGSPKTEPTPSSDAPTIRSLADRTNCDTESNAHPTRSKAMDWEGIIVKVPGTCGGKPIVKGTRLPVSLLLEFKADGATEDYLLENYPTLYREGLRAAYAYAEAHGMVAYADWGAEDCPYHNPDGSLKAKPGRSV